MTTKAEDAPNQTEIINFQQAFAKKPGSFRSSYQSLSGRSYGSNNITINKGNVKPVIKKQLATKKQIKLQNLNYAIMVLQKNLIQMTESQVQMSDSRSPSTLTDE